MEYGEASTASYPSLSRQFYDLFVRGEPTVSPMVFTANLDQQLRRNGAGGFDFHAGAPDPQASYSALARLGMTLRQSPLQALDNVTNPTHRSQLLRYEFNDLEAHHQRHAPAATNIRNRSLPRLERASSGEDDILWPMRNDIRDATNVLQVNALGGTAYFERLRNLYHEAHSMTRMTRPDSGLIRTLRLRDDGDEDDRRSPDQVQEEHYVTDHDTYLAENPNLHPSHYATLVLEGLRTSHPDIFFD